MDSLHVSLFLCLWIINVLLRRPRSPSPCPSLCSLTHSCAVRRWWQFEPLGHRGSRQTVSPPQRWRQTGACSLFRRNEPEHTFECCCWWKLLHRDCGPFNAKSKRHTTNRPASHPSLPRRMGILEHGGSVNKAFFEFTKCAVCLHNLHLLHWSKANLKADLWVRAEGHFLHHPPPLLIRTAGPRLVSS